MPRHVPRGLHRSHPARAAGAAAILLAVAPAAVPPAAAQGLEPPTEWRVDLDAPAVARAPVRAAPETAEAYWFVEMRPGWHLTMGPGGRLSDPAFRAEGRYALEAEIFLFPGSSAEGYGLFFGGRGEGAEATWIAALLRRDGSAALLRHGPGVHDWLVPWTRLDAAKPQAGIEPTENVLRVDVGRDSVQVLANGTRLFGVARAGLETDGAFGFRVGRELNLHVSTLDHTRRLAGVPAPQ